MTDKIRILIVEDDQYLLTLFRFALQTRTSEFEITTAADSDSALQQAREQKPDLILLDIMLPGDVDGVEICRQIRRDPAMRGTGVVMVTAVDDMQVRQAAIEAGAADYWLKPINTRGLVERVRAVLNLKRTAGARPGSADLLHEPRTTGVTLTFTEAGKPGLDTAVNSIGRTFASLDPDDWAEIQALAEARLAFKKAAK